MYERAKERERMHKHIWTEEGYIVDRDYLYKKLKRRDKNDR